MRGRTLLFPSGPAIRLWGVVDELSPGLLRAGKQIKQGPLAPHRKIRRKKNSSSNPRQILKRQIKHNPLRSRASPALTRP